MLYTDLTGIRKGCVFFRIPGKITNSKYISIQIIGGTTGGKILIRLFYSLRGNSLEDFGGGLGRYKSQLLFNYVRYALIIL